MNDLTIIYYTANTIRDNTAAGVRDYLLKVTENKFPIISVSQKPINFGENICVGEIGKSKYNCYKQILIGVKEAKTKFVACAEDDTLYAKEHFEYRPPEGVFSYENNMWLAEEKMYWRMDTNDRGGMWGCIAETENLLINLTTRYAVYPTDPLVRTPEKKNKYLFWGEPGKHDGQFGMENRYELFESKNPTVVFTYRGSMGGYKSRPYFTPRKPENVRYHLEPFGEINKLWNSYWS